MFSVATAFASPGSCPGWCSSPADPTGFPDYSTHTENSIKPLSKPQRSYGSKVQIKNWGRIKWFKIGEKERYPVFNKLFWPDWWMQSSKGGGGKTRTCWSNGPGWYHALTVLMLLWHWSYFISQVLCSGRAPQCLLTLGTVHHVPPECRMHGAVPRRGGDAGLAAAPTPQTCKGRSFSNPQLQPSPHSIPFLSSMV